MRVHTVLSRFLLVIFAVLACVSFIQPKAFADDYEVNATVPAPLPGVPPVVDNPDSGTPVASPTVEISGTCEIVVPNLIVELVRAGQIIGSTVCQNDGHFSVTVSLVLGVNIIIPRFRTITGDYGVDGVPLSLNYSPPPTNETVTPKGVTPPTGTSEPLRISRLESFIVFTPGQSAKLEFTIGGGAAPYSVLIDWGDNKVNKVDVSQAGTVTLDHTYKKAQFYTIHIKLTDKNKLLAVLDLAAVTYAKYSGLSAPQKVLANKHNWLKIYLPIGIVVLSTWAIAYKVGLKRATSPKRKVAVKRRK